MNVCSLAFAKKADEIAFGWDEFRWLVKAVQIKMDNSNTPPQHIKMSQPATPCHKRGIKRTFKQRKSPHNQQIHQQQQQYFDDLSDSESDIPTDYIDNMLEEGLRESLDKSALPSHEERKKIVLKKREQDYFEMLPESKWSLLKIVRIHI